MWLDSLNCFSPIKFRHNFLINESRISIEERGEVSGCMQHSVYFKTRLCKSVKNAIALKSFDTPDPQALGESALKRDRLSKRWQPGKLGQCCLGRIKKALGGVET